MLSVCLNKLMILMIVVMLMMAMMMYFYDSTTMKYYNITLSAVLLKQRVNPGWPHRERDRHVLLSPRSTDRESHWP